ncbi:MAG: propanediol utilization protein [Lachnospiraceae bacterium]|nr:propanediol utilization protein [Lachnospiraceae bacterium]
MNPAQIEMTKPTVHVLCSPEVPEPAFQQLLYGLEEEGIPWETWTKTEGDALALAWTGAQASRLGVGVGMDGQNAVLNISKLDHERPLFQIPVRSLEQARILGANAARLVKKLPLKPLNREVRA